MTTISQEIERLSTMDLSQIPTNYREYAIIGRDKQIAELIAQLPKNEAIRAENMLKPQFRFCYRLVDLLIEMYELDEAKPAVFRSIRTSQYRPGSKKIVFGYDCINHAYLTGQFTEYYKLAYIWHEAGYPCSLKHNNGRNKRWAINFEDGLHAVYCIATHEFAHQMQYILDMGRNHDYGFQKALKTIIKDFPYQEVKYLGE